MITRYLSLINVIFLTAAIYLGVKAFYSVAVAKIDDVPATVPTNAIEFSQENEKQTAVSDYQEIINRNLFNTKQKQIQKSAAVNLEGLKQTQLNLKLIGTVSGDGNGAYAVIEDVKTRKQNLYRAGDTVQHASIKMVLRKKVVLNVNNQDEILIMDERSEKTETSSPASEPSASLSQPSEEAVTSIQLKYADIETAVQDVNQLMSQINIRPYFVKGKPEGLLLTRIQPDSFFNRIGLRSGDIITGLDGKEIETVDDALEIYERMKSASDMSLQLKRRGKPQIIDYHIE